MPHSAMLHEKRIAGRVSEFRERVGSAGIRFNVQEKQNGRSQDSFLDIARL
jgi:hypothetical protein